MLPQIAPTEIARPTSPATTSATLFSYAQSPFIPPMARAPYTVTSANPPNPANHTNSGNHSGNSVPAGAPGTWRESTPCPSRTQIGTATHSAVVNTVAAE